MKRALTLGLTVFVLCGPASSAGAATAFELGPRLGLAVPTGGWNDDADEAFAWGFFLGYAVKSNFSLDLAFLRHSHGLARGLGEFREETEGILQGLTGVNSAELRINELTLSGRYRFFDGWFSPYLTGGAGVYVWKVEVSGVAAEQRETTTTGPSGTTSTTVSTTTGNEISASSRFTDVGLTGGGGVRFMVTGELSVGGEVTYTYVFGGFENGYVSVLGTVSYDF